MGYLINVKRSKIFEEFNEVQRKEFYIKEKNIVHNTDTLYYSVKLKNDLKDIKDNKIEHFIKILSYYKSDDDLENEIFDFETQFKFRNTNFTFYKYCLSYGNLFDVFIAGNLPNDYTPRIVVQIRSEMLWALGDSSALKESYNRLVKLLNIYDIEVDSVNENRIDFCFHTNIIQNPSRCFNDNVISNYCITTFKIGQKVFRKSHKTLTTEYLSFGNRKSNNLFFRSYNKSREVCELAYKDFFLDIWLSQQLISNYDYFIYTYCYQHKSYDKRYMAMSLYYIKFGSDKNLIKYLKQLLESETSTLQQFRQAIKDICPEPTLVQNIEFQTMRKFYYNSKDIDYLPIHTDLSEPNLLRVMQILDNRKIFLDYLFSKTLVFTKIDIDEDLSKYNEKGYMADWWYRIYKLKLDESLQMKYKRKYNNNNNIEFLLNRITSSLATLSLMKNNEDTNLIQDMSSLICSFNDNDDYLENKSQKYDIIKNKKKKAQKNINAFKTFNNNFE